MSNPSKVYYGDEWRYADSAPRTTAAGVPRPPTRAEEQARVDDAYANKKMTVEEWRAASTELSDPEIWSAAGKALKP